VTNWHLHSFIIGKGVKLEREEVNNGTACRVLGAVCVAGLAGIKSEIRKEVKRDFNWWISAC
jgi:hypothetical protein